MGDASILPYATPRPPPKSAGQWVVLRPIAAVAACLILWWSLADPRHLVWSGAPNECDMVRSMALLPASENTDLGPYVEASFAGFHVVHWSGWRRGGVYLVVPPYAVLSVLAVLMGGTFRLTRGRP